VLSVCDQAAPAARASLQGSGRIVLHREGPLSVATPGGVCASPGHSLLLPSYHSAVT
jgi:hypothetical protein